MRIGVTFPQLNDPAEIRAFAQTAEAVGYDDLMVFDHVLLPHRERPDGRISQAPYDVTIRVHEPLVLFGFLAAATSRITLGTWVMILPQRQTALVAKQVAEADLLSGGRIRLGVGLGWNRLEYEALNEDFTTRGRRLEEQIDLMRALWTEEVVTFEGRWHSVSKSGMNPRPVQQPIPVWMGGMTDAMLQRIARRGDGWLPMWGQGEDAVATMQQSIVRLRDYASRAGRDPSEIGIELTIAYGKGDPDTWRGQAERWREIGATHVQFNVMAKGISFDEYGTSVGEYVDRLHRFYDAVAPINDVPAAEPAETED